ncbi:aminoglycoside adenylyltransferase family protein [Rathayibacter sp. CAU 1779]
MTSAHEHRPTGEHRPMGAAQVDGAAIDSVDPGFARVLAAASGALGERMLAAIVHGSATSGGLRPDSDLDLLVIVRSALDDATRATLVDRLLDVSGSRARRGPARPTEVTVVVHGDIDPWRCPPITHLQYGEWLRAEAEAGTLAGPHADPDLAVVLTAARDTGVAVVGPSPDILIPAIPPKDLERAIVDSLPELVDNLRGDERNVLLTLARMQHTLETGRIVPKDVAAERIARRLPDDEAVVLVRAAAAYRGELQDEWMPHPPALEAYVRRAQREISRHTEP